MIRFNEIEEQIMDILWEKKTAFPKVIISNLPEPTPPYNTVLSTIRKLEKEGHIGYTVFGKFHEYYPITKIEDYKRSIYQKLFNDILSGSKMDLLSYFMKEEKVNIKELEKIISKLKNEEK